MRNIATPVARAKRKHRDALEHHRASPERAGIRQQEGASVAATRDSCAQSSNVNRSSPRRWKDCRRSLLHLFRQAKSELRAA